MPHKLPGHLPKQEKYHFIFTPMAATHGAAVAIVDWRYQREAR